MLTGGLARSKQVPGEKGRAAEHNVRLDAFFTEYDAAWVRLSPSGHAPGPSCCLSQLQRGREAGTMARWDMLAAVYACLQLSLSCHPVDTFSSHTPLASHAAGLLMLPDMTTPTRSHNTKTSRIPAHDPRRWSPSAR
jgi:hypothetical protein